MDGRSGGGRRWSRCDRTARQWLAARRVRRMRFGPHATPRTPGYPESMRQVAVVGIGKTAFGAFPDRDLRSLAVEAGQKALENAGAKPSQVEAFHLGNFAGPSFVGQNHLAPYIAGAMGINGVACTRFAAACASNGS